MKKLIFFALLCVAAWYGWNHYSGLRRAPGNEAVIVNTAGRAIERVRLTADGQTQVAEVIEDGARVTLPFRVSRDSEFRLHWQWRGREGEPDWHGGLVSAGPMRSRHVFTVMPDGGVIWTTEAITSAK